ncbi:DUF2971 domain-containing protein [Leptospira bandrabouensis]|uniref:DUF2971 domain-containing protein n=1 Tax=Leptospira bandrabouensis TaxID=2484903 RepID=A0A6H3P3Y4_9LEPT|nr:DUF2971 domain-containing protein [Leptospira bandrabouensis]MCG6153134.1 hypothetical protein [Leptospira bandrabouensis]TGN06270.1 hypothetical protein EHR07_17310 [Leptospira bandrabouensis]TGN16604.1 hypothetical protein EHR08_10230 [Leptospira bandrabouensis]
MIEYIYNSLRKLFSADPNKLLEYDRIFSLQFIEKNIKILKFENFEAEYLLYFEKYVNERYLRNEHLKNTYHNFRVNKQIRFTEHFQDELFKILFSLGNQKKKFYHYTSFDSLVSILQNNTIRFSGIAGLNDKSETYYSDYLLNKNIKNPFHHTRIKSFNSKFILSTSLNKDELNQWRLYGDNGSGVSLEFETNFQGNGYYFLFGKIAYGSEIFNIILDLIIGLIQGYNSFAIFNQLSIWKNFVKHEDY